MPKSVHIQYKVFFCVQKNEFQIFIWAITPKV